MKIKGKKIIILLAIVVILALCASSFLFNFSKENIKWGVTFSAKYAQDELGLNWQETYLAILDDLKVDNIRLSAYWDSIEIERDNYDFSQLDYQINEASKRNVNIILAVGRRLPRWPECHDPSWLANLSKDEARQEQLELVDLVIKRYDKNENIKSWQIENEPYLGTFGQCPPLDEELFLQEIALAKELSSKPILVTDSGELNFWIKAAKTRAEIIGSTLYRVVYNKKIGYVRYPIPPIFYYAKASFIKHIFKTKSVINSELQTEAWHTAEKDLAQMTAEETAKSMDLKQFKKNVAFAQRAGFDEIYLWGAEWWYFLKVKQDHDEIWNEAKKIWP
ncbi:MAG: hypothetical protein Q7K65_05695 [Candidatus Buchananbacteria bacterium]|nr:hypothetical protein [Candidatus Buchananbacteria bacterium]